MASPIKYNAYLQYGGESFGLYVKTFAYPLTTQNRGESQSRHGFTIYPYRVVRGAISVTVQFRSIDEYKKFGRFIKDYHENVVGDAGGIMHFISYKLTRSARGDVSTYGISPSKTIWYGVSIEHVPMTLAFDMPPAPEVTFTMRILTDEYMSLTNDSSVVGSYEDMVGETVVYSDSIATSGDKAFGIAVGGKKNSVNGQSDNGQKTLAAAQGCA